MAEGSEDGAAPAMGAQVSTSPDIVLGAFNHGTGKFEDATGTGDATYNTLVVGYSNKSGSESITFPSVGGYTYKRGSSTAGYTYTYALTDKTAAQVAEDFIREIKFENTTNDTEIYFALSRQASTSSDVKTIYFSGTQHYYQYVPYTGVKTWIEAYNEAKNMTFNGMHGYLATITTRDEDVFIYRASSSVGWLGGTVLNHGNQDGSLYYESFSTTSPFASGWYWACGPERGRVFYNAQQYTSSTDSQNTSYYYNWDRGEEPNNVTSGNPTWIPETCLATLLVGKGKETSSIISGAYSWNNIQFNRKEDDYNQPHGYFVEYGDQAIGDSGTGNTQNDDSITAYANFKKWTATFDPNAQGATTPKASKQVGNGDKYGELPEPAYNGHTFKGWYTEPTGGTQVTSESVVNLSGNQTLYAHWELDAPVVTTQPDDVEATYGTIPDTARMSVAATAPAGTTTSYQWYRMPVDETSGGTPIEGATDSVYRVPQDTEAGTYRYYCIVSVTDGTETVMAASSPARAVIRQADLNPTVSMDDWVEGETPGTPSLSGNHGDGDVTYEYKPKDAADSEYSTDMPTRVGEYVVRATVAPTRNYIGATATDGFTVHPASIPSDNPATTIASDGQTATPGTVAETVVPISRGSVDSPAPAGALPPTGDASLPMWLVAFFAAMGVLASCIGVFLRRFLPVE